MTLWRRFRAGGRGPVAAEVPGTTVSSLHSHGAHKALLAYVAELATSGQTATLSALAGATSSQLAALHIIAQPPRAGAGSGRSATPSGPSGPSES